MKRTAFHHSADRVARGLRFAAPAVALAFLAASAQARFGYEPADPVRTEDVAGEYSFAARLRDADGAPVTARRTGSAFVEGFAMPMDRWTVAVGTNEVVLWIYAYGPTNSLAAPEGFSLADPPPSASSAAATAEEEAAHAPALPPAAPGEWPGLDDEAALAAWSESVRTNTTLFTSARFRDEMLLPLLRREALEPLLAGTDTNKPWFAEARAYAEDALHRCWFLSITDRPGPEWGRAYDFTVREGSSDPFLSWMSVFGQHKWHWDDQARPQLDELERSVASPDGTPFQRFLAAHARQAVDPSDAHLAALYAAAAGWAASCRPAESRAVRQVLVQFFGTPGPAFRAALAAAGADPWIALVFEGSAELDSHTAAGADKAAEALEKAHALHPDFPEAAVLLITVALRHNAIQDADLWFRRALAAQIDHRTAWAAYCRFNHPCTLGTPDRLVRLAEAALATKRDDIGLPLEYARAMAAVRHDTGAPDEAFWRDPDVAAKMEAALDPQIANPDLHAYARALAADLLAGVRLLNGDLDGALEAFGRAPVPVWSGDANLAFSDFGRISTILAGLTGPNAERIAPLYRKYAAGDWAACAAEADAVWDACSDISPFEADLLSTVAAEAWLHTGYEAGEPRYFGVLRKRQFSDWRNYSSGLALEEGTDDGSGHTRDGNPQWLRLDHAVPAELSASGRFEPWGAPDAPHVLGVQLGPRLDCRDISGTRLVAFLREKERVGAAIVADPASWDAATPVEPAVWRRLPEGWPVRWRVVSAAGRLLVFLGDEERPVLDAPLAAAGAAAPPAGPFCLWFGHRNARFFGVTLRKPDADETALAAESAANARAEAAEKEPHAEGAEDDSHAEAAEGAEDDSHAEAAEGAEDDSHAEAAEGAEDDSHAEGAEDAEEEIPAAFAGDPENAKAFQAARKLARLSPEQAKAMLDDANRARKEGDAVQAASLEVDRLTRSRRLHEALAAASNRVEAVRAARAGAKGAEPDPMAEAVAFNDYAWVLHLAGRDAEALPLARCAVERVALASGESWLAGADGGASLDTLACVLTALGETDEAKERFAAAFESADSRTAPAWDSLMRARRAVGRKTRQFHLAQCWERAGETAPAKAILDALRAEGFVPPPPEDAAYDALAEKLGAAPLPPGARERAALDVLVDLVAGVFFESECREPDDRADPAMAPLLERVAADLAALPADGAPEEVRAALDGLRRFMEDSAALVAERPDALPAAGEFQTRLKAFGRAAKAAGARTAPLLDLVR